jgi:hypothetical protein
VISASSTLVGRPPGRLHKAASRRPAPATHRTHRPAPGSAGGEGATEHAGGGDGLGAGVDRAPRCLQVLGEVRDQAPRQQVRVPFAGIWMASDDKRVLRRCHIPACRVVWRRVPGAEQADDCLGRKVLGVSTAHAGRMARLALTSSSHLRRIGSEAARSMIKGRKRNRPPAITPPCQRNLRSRRLQPPAPSWARYQPHKRHNCASSSPRRLKPAIGCRR